MKILVIADEESQKIWDFFRKEDYADIDLVISCGDLKADYLSFIATMIAVPVLYVHGNHDDKYERKENDNLQLGESENQRKDRRGE